MARGTFTFDGKRYDISAKTEKEVIEKIALKKRDLEEGRKAITKTMAVGEWWDIFLETYKRPSVNETTYKNLKSYYKVWIKPAIGSMRIKDVRPIHCQAILNSMTGKSKTHILKIKLLLQNIFVAAQDNNLIIENPAEKLTMPKAEAGTHRTITPQEREMLLSVAETHKYGLWVKVMLYCGPRPGETALIQGQHIDFKAKKLFIDGTKSKAAKRWVPIPDHLLEDFKNAGLKPFHYIFTNRDGFPINRTNRRRMWESIKREINIRKGCKVFRSEVMPPFWVAADLVPYCLRHTYCTDLQAAGVPINVAKEFMGHSDISTTANIYTHSSDTAFSTAADAMNQYHCGKGCGNEACNH